jgi:hypothetical protein
LDQIAASVVEHRCRHRSHVDRLLYESHASSNEAFVLASYVIDGKRRERDSVRGERVLERADGRVLVGLENEFGAIGFVGRHH